MIPILFDREATVFVGNGIGRLSDAIECKITEKRNDSYELSMIYPMTGRYFHNIMLMSIIFAQPAPNKPPQPFRVYSISSPIGGRVTINAEHISYQLCYIPVKTFSANNAAQALERLAQNAVGDMPFSFETDLDKKGVFELKSPCSVKMCLGGQDGSILDVYHGEYEYNIYNVFLHESRGEDKSKSVVISYGKNITDLTQDQLLEDVYTAIMPYYIDSNNKAVYLTTASGCETAPIVYTQYNDNYPFSRINVMDMSQYVDKTNGSTVIQKAMYTATQNYIEKNNIGLPKLSLKVEFVDLKRAVGADRIATFPDLYLCDTISVRYEELGVTATARINEVVYDVLQEKYESISVGDEKVTLADQILGRVPGEQGAAQLTISAIPDEEIISIMRGA